MVKLGRHKNLLLTLTVVCVVTLCLVFQSIWDIFNLVPALVISLIAGCILITWIALCLKDIFLPPVGGRTARTLNLTCNLAMIYGVIAFFGMFLICQFASRLNLPSFNWPIGYTGGVIRDSEGHYIAPHAPSCRIQIYDRDKHFIRGWFVDSWGGHVSLELDENGNINVLASKARMRYVYSIDGTLIAQRQYKRRQEAHGTNPSSAVWFSAPWLLYPLSHPFIAWGLVLLGGLGSKWLVSKSGSRV